MPNEQEVKLCNYMDVYSNDYIVNNTDFMIATASISEIERFKVEVADVLITKDSETPFDIGIPAVVTTNIENLVCGYHLAQLKPYKNIVDPIYLAKQLGSNNVAKYYLKNASGSTRYGLSNGAIARTPIPLFPLSQQKKIAKILTTIDQLIEKTQALIDKHTTIKQGMMADLFTRGIDPTTGQLRPSVEQAPHLYKETELGWVPKKWKVVLLDDFAQRGSGHTPNKSTPEYWDGGIKWVSLADSIRLDDLYIYKTDKEISRQGLTNSSAVLHPKGTVILSRDAGIWKSAILAMEMAVSQHFMAWTCGKLSNHIFLYFWLQYKKPLFENIAMGSTILTIGLDYFKRLRISAPNINEQIKIGARLLKIHDQICSQKNYLHKLKNEKSGLMQDLLTGKIRV